MKLLRKMIVIYFIVLISSYGCKKYEPPTKPPVINLPDTTSHDFTWLIDVLGDGNASRLRDVCIINENDIWAVGRICLQDLTGEFINPPYNLVHWNGEKWELMSIKFKYYYGLLYADAECIFLFDQENIVISSGGSIMHWNGHSWKNLPYLFNHSSSIGNIYSIWGKSIDEFYGVGLEGSIVHFNGTSWQKIESGTNQPINDIWGLLDQNSQQHDIFCVASDKYHGGEKRIFQILDNQVVQEIDWTPQRAAYSIWFGKDTPLYVCGSGLYIYENEQWNEVTDLPKIFKNRVRGNHQNDVFVIGDFGIFTHYNGNSWKIYDSLSLSSGNYEGLAVEENFVVAVGWNDERAVVCRGTRSQ